MTKHLTSGILTLCLLAGQHAAASDSSASRARTGSKTQSYVAGVTHLTPVVSNDTVLGAGGNGAPRVVTICGGECDYSTVGEACAAEASTAANPIEYRIGPGTFTGQVHCSGQDFATFVGSGRGSTTITASGIAANDGVFMMGSSTNWTVDGFTIRGHRALHASSGGGLVVVRNMELESDRQGLDDSFYSESWAPGTLLILRHNSFRTAADGFTVNTSSDYSVVAKGNEFSAKSGGDDPQIRGYRFGSVPCSFVSQDDSFSLSAARDGALLIEAYGFLGFDPSCENATATISGAVGALTNSTSGHAGSSVQLLKIEDTATTLMEVRLANVTSIVTATDSENTSTFGVDVDNHSTLVTVHGGKFRTEGGIQNFDFNTNGSGKIKLFGTDYLVADTRDGGTVAGDFRVLGVSGSATFTSPAAPTFRGTTPVENGFVMDNTSQNQGASPRFSLSAGGNPDQEAYFYADAEGAFAIQNDGFNPMARLTQAGDLLTYGTFARLNKAGATLYVGNGGSSDGNSICFDASSTDSCIRWNDTDDRLEVTGATVIRHVPLGTAPPACSIGDLYVDSSGAYCACTAANSWSNMTTIGSCA